jgi:hypothetical protein
LAESAPVNFRRKRPHDWGYRWAPPVAERVPPQFHGGQRRKEPFAIEWRFPRTETFPGLTRWATWNRYATEEARDETLRNLQRKSQYLEYRPCP